MNWSTWLIPHTRQKTVANVNPALASFSRGPKIRWKARTTVAVHSEEFEARMLLALSHCHGGVLIRLQALLERTKRSPGLSDRQWHALRLLSEHMQLQLIALDKAKKAFRTDPDAEPNR